MTKFQYLARSLLCALAACSLAYAPATAETLVFTGTANATATTFADPTCAPLTRRGIIPFEDGSGTSTLGNFRYSHNACNVGATGPVEGTFALDFSGSLLSGLFSGTAAARPGVTGLFDQVFTYTVTGGTGRFLGANGSFMNNGTVDVRGGPPSRLTLNFNGTINAVPEPGTWAMMILGFGLVGVGMRRRRGAVSLRAVCSL
jgi:hypothetical protein